MPFADELIGVDAAHALTHAIAAAAPGHPLDRLTAAPDALAPLSLRERSDLLRDALLGDLAGDYASFAASIRVAMAGPVPFTGWMIWPVTSAIAQKAVEEGTTDAFDDAMLLLSLLTSRLTSEFAIRTLLAHDLDRALAIVQGWTASDDEHLRRLASEGTRPFLPWSRRVPGIIAEPRSTLPILNALYRDESEYVRRSVANHLNDLSRENAGIVVETAAAWLAEPDEAGSGGTTPKLVRHALRTLIKRGDPGALALMGFTADAELAVTGPVLTLTEVPFGGALGFSATVVNSGTEPVTLAIDYIVHHTKSNGGQTGKTFKLTTVTLAAGETLDLRRDHSFRAITTRRYYPGPHAIELQINGVVTARADFTLLAP